MTPATSAPAAGDEIGPGEPWRSILSLAVFIHLFCVLVTMSANYGRSALQSRLLDILAPYTEFVHADLGYAQFQLTDGFPDADHFLELAPAGKEASTSTAADRLPDDSPRGSPNRYRQQLLARRLAAYAADEQDAPLAAEMARAIGGAWLREHEQTNVVVRVRRRETQPMNPAERNPPLPADPFDARYESTVYEADVFMSDGEVFVTKREGRGVSAPTTGS